MSRYFDYLFVGNFQVKVVPLLFVDYYQADENSSPRRTYATNPLEDLSKIVSNVGRRGH